MLPALRAPGRFFRHVCECEEARPRVSSHLHGRNQAKKQLDRTRRRHYFSPIHPVISTRVPKVTSSGRSSVQLHPAINNTTVHCYGVAHDHAGYERFVEESITRLKPDVVALEYSLIHSLQLLSLSGGNEGALHERAPLESFGLNSRSSKWTQLDDTNPTRLAAFERFLLRHIDRDRCLQQRSQTIYGREMLTCISTAKSIGADLWLLDQDEWLQESRQPHSARKLSLLEQYFSGWLFRCGIPKYTDPVCDRDRHMASALLHRICNQKGDEPKSVAFVMGIAHVSGVQREWTRLIEQARQSAQTSDGSSLRLALRETSLRALEETSCASRANQQPHSLTSASIDLLLDIRCCVPHNKWEGYASAWRLFGSSFNSGHILTAFTGMVSRADRYNHMDAVRADPTAQSLHEACVKHMDTMEDSAPLKELALVALDTWKHRTTRAHNSAHKRRVK